MVRKNTKERDDLIKRIYEGLARLNTPEHDQFCNRDPYGNYRDYRIATHNGADYYVSDWYGIAMETVEPEWLTDDELLDIIKELE